MAEVAKMSTALFGAISSTPFVQGLGTKHTE